MTKDREDKIPFYQNHMSPSQLAEFLREECADIGREYETYGDAWDEEDDVIKVGLLNLILDKLTEMTKNSDPLRGHRDWLKNWRDDVANLNKKHAAQRKRLTKMFGTDKLGPDMKTNFDIHQSSRMYRLDYTVHYREFCVLKRQVARMQSVKSPSDLTKLRGVSKKKADSIIASMSSDSQATGQSTPASEASQ